MRRAEISRKDGFLSIPIPSIQIADLDQPLISYTVVLEPFLHRLSHPYPLLIPSLLIGCCHPQKTAFASSSVDSQRQRTTVQSAVVSSHDTTDAISHLSPIATAAPRRDRIASHLDGHTHIHSDATRRQRAQDDSPIHDLVARTRVRASPASDGSLAPPQSGRDCATLSTESKRQEDEKQTSSLATTAQACGSKRKRSSSSTDTSMEEPRLSINVRAALPTAAVTPRFLEPLAPPTYPFTSPAWSLPQKPRAIALLDVVKDHELLTTYTVDQKPVYLIGRNAVVCDIVLNHCSVSRLHATIIHHRDGAAYLVDMGSCHGTFLDDMRLRPLLPTLITHGSVLKFGASSRSYTFKSFETREQILERVQSRIGLDPHEMEVEQNTLMNRALSYRLGFSIPLTHKATDAEGDALMQPAFPVRQMEASTSAASLIRRTHSEDNTLAGVFPVGPVAPQNVGSGILVGEPGRKRSRTQSAGLPITTSQTQSSLQPQLEGDADDDDDDGLPKRVHFSEHPVETIPPHPAYFSPEPSPLLSGASLPSSASSSPQIVPESHLPPPSAAKASGPHGLDQPKRPLSPPPPLRLAESPEHDTVADTS